MAGHGRTLRVSEFADAERRRGMSDGTVAKRVGIVRRWLDHVADPFAADWRDVETFLDQSRMAAPTSRYAAVSHLHQFYRWAQRQDLTATDPTVLVLRPRIPVALPRPAHDTDLALALTVATGETRAAIALAALCGLRCVELARLQWVDVSPAAVRVRGKGNRERVIPVPAEAVDALDQLDRTGAYVLDGWQADTGAEGRLVSHKIRRFFMSIGSTCTAHQLRHWCATRAYAATGDLGAVQDYLGHASPATTRIYARLDPGRLDTVAAGLQIPALRNV